MRIPNADRAVVDSLKLTDYCLNPAHPRGRHKARVFNSALGLTINDSDELRTALMDAVVHEEAELGDSDAFGQRYVLESDLAAPRGSERIRSARIIRTGEDFPRFVSCYVM